MGLAQRARERFPPAHLLEALRGHPPVERVLIPDEYLPVEPGRALRVSGPCQRASGEIQELAGHERPGVLARRAFELLGRSVQILIAIPVPEDVPAGEESVLAVRIGLREPGEVRQGGFPVVSGQLAAGQAVERPLAELVILFERQQFFENPFLGGPAFQPPERLPAVVEGRRPEVRALYPGQRAERGAEPAAVELLDPDPELNQFSIARLGEAPGDLPVVFVGLPVVPRPGETLGPPHGLRILLGSRRRLDVPPLVQPGQLPAGRERLRVGRHVVVEGLQPPGGFLPAAEPLQDRRGSGQRFSPELEGSFGDYHLQVGEGLFAIVGPAEDASELEVHLEPP